MTTPTRARAGRSSLGTAAVLLLLGTAGCSWQGSDGACASAAGASAEVVNPGDVPTADESSANLVLDVATTSAEPVRVTVTFDDVPALDVRAPGTPEVCAHGPVRRYGYEVPSGPLVVEVTTDGDQTGAVEVEVHDRPQWVVVGVQEGFPLAIDLWRERPLHG